MSTLDTDHNHFTLENRQTADYDPSKNSTHPSDDRRSPAPVASSSHSIPPLPAYTYNPATTKRPHVSTSFEQYASDASVNGFTGEPPREDDSPDPHDFYRRYQNSFARGSIDGLGQGDIVITTREDGMTRSRQQQMPTPVSARTNGFDLPSLSSRVYGGYTSRYQPSPVSDRSPLCAAKSSPSLSGTARNRQTSLKDLVDRFNSNTDEVPPLPRKHGSRSASNSSNPANLTPANNTNPATSISYARARNSSQPKASRAGLARKESPIDQRHSATASRSNKQRGRGNEDAKASPRSKRTGRPDPKAYASQSMTNLHPDGHSLVRKPLFGEILAPSIEESDSLGYGIPGRRRRRGSEGSMRSPNPMFPEEPHQDTGEVSPSSPSAWYLGVIPTLEEIKMEKTVPSLPPGMHRRTRSDFTGMPMRSPLPDKTPHPSPPQRLLSPHRPAGSAGTARRGSQSRIPVSTRRRSINSDSGNSASSTRANSAADRYSGHIISPPKGTSGLPRFNQKSRSPVRNPRSSPGRNSPRRDIYNNAGQRPATSPRLAAYISAPMPKKSPPLRSSRPRQPVSSASTSASRARAVDRFSSQETRGSKNAKEHRSKRPPEIGGVDFAARRQKIQQAFTQTVKETERQEEIEVERQRASTALGDKSQHSQVGPEGSGPASVQQQDVSDDSERPNLDDLREFDEDIFQNSAKEQDELERELTINTGHLSERSVLDLSQEDSPTLGGFNRFPHTNHLHQRTVTPPSDIEPTSAVTADTSDSVDTFFDNEPQDDSENLYQEHQTLLNHIMNMRDASPTSPRSIRKAGAVEGSVSDKDDRESIQIMLGETPVFEKADFDYPEDENSKDISNEGSNSRWSMASRTSSIRSKDRCSESQERDAPMERIDEHSPPQPSQANHLSISTASSELTPHPWSPVSFASPQTSRTTMDSDAYSTINRVLDHYHHDPSVVSPELMSDMQQHFLNQSPDLARQGGWDPKKVTQLYLQQLARDRSTQPSTLPDPLKFQLRKPADPQLVTSAPTEHVEQMASEKMVRALEHAMDVDEEHSESPEVSTGLYVDDGELKPQRASLNRPGDWDMSPSIGDWIHLQAADSPSDERPNLPPKDRRYFSREASELPAREASRLSGEYRPELPEIQGTGEGLGLAINITSPQEGDSPTIPPPFPDHGPPPPPINIVNQHTPSPPVGMRSPPSPSIYSKHVPSTMPPNSYPPSGHTNGSSDSVRQPGTASSSGPPSGTPSISQVRASIETPSVTTGSASQESPPSPEQKRLTRRRHIIKELVDTEHSFGQDMKVVDDIYKGTSNVIIISQEDVKTLFGNSDQIVAFSTSFLDSLKSASKAIYILPKSKRWRNNRVSTATSASGNTDESSVGGVELSDDEKDRHTSIGEAFTQNLSAMEKVYAEYLKNHDAANQKLQQLQKNPKVQIWLKECRAYAHDLTQAWSLDSLLVKPVQRILKYPLLLEQLLEATPENHPDFSQLDIASREIKGISFRINEMKKRADIMEQVSNTRKRKESDVRIGLSKAFGRRTEKLRQHVGLSDMVDDKEYNTVSEKFGSSFMMLQVVMKDVDLYTNEVQRYMTRFCEVIASIENYMDVGQTNYHEIESKWRRFRMTTTEMSMTAVTDHVTAVKKYVIEPMITLIKIYENPDKLMQKRNKRVMDYARYRAIKDRGDKPDKKTTEQGEQFMAVNDTLKDELSKLYSLTGRLMEECLNNLIQLQVKWNVLWRKKLSQVLEDGRVPASLEEIVQDFTGDFAFSEANVLALGICNGSLLADAVNMVNFGSPTTLTGDENSSTHFSTRQGSSVDMSKRRTLSVSSEASPVLPQPDFGTHNDGSFFNVDSGVYMPHMHAGLRLTQHSNNSRQRVRANSAVSTNSPRTPEMPGSYRSYSNASTPVNSGPMRPSSAQTRTATEPPPSHPRQSVETPSYNRMSEDSTRMNRPASGSTYPQVTHASQARASSPSARYSGFFSSAMPMSDSPRTESPIEVPERRDLNVIFLAASVYEFNIDRARKQAGYPYLTYVAGEIFDVIGENGELWLAKNQDDATNQVGWIWNKHFVKLAS